MKSDFTRYAEIQREWKALLDVGRANSPELQTLWREMEEIKNRYGGMPPEIAPENEKSA